MKLATLTLCGAMLAAIAGCTTILGFDQDFQEVPATPAGDQDAESDVTTGPDVVGPGVDGGGADSPGDDANRSDTGSDGGKKDGGADARSDGGKDAATTIPWARRRRSSVSRTAARAFAPAARTV